MRGITCSTTFLASTETHPKAGKSKVIICSHNPRHGPKDANMPVLHSDNSPANKECSGCGSCKCQKMGPFSPSISFKTWLAWHCPQKKNQRTSSSSSFFFFFPSRLFSAIGSQWAVLLGSFQALGLFLYWPVSRCAKSKGKVHWPVRGGGGGGDWSLRGQGGVVQGGHWGWGVRLRDCDGGLGLRKWGWRQMLLTLHVWGKRSIWRWGKRWRPGATVLACRALWLGRGWWWKKRLPHSNGLPLRCLRRQGGTWNWKGVRGRLVLWLCGHRWGLLRQSGRPDVGVHRLGWVGRLGWCRLPIGPPPRVPTRWRWLRCADHRGVGRVGCWGLPVGCGWWPVHRLPGTLWLLRVQVGLHGYEELQTGHRLRGGRLGSRKCDGTPAGSCKQWKR